MLKNNINSDTTLSLISFGNVKSGLVKYALLEPMLIEALHILEVAVVVLLWLGGSGELLGAACFNGSLAGELDNLTEILGREVISTLILFLVE